MEQTCLHGSEPWSELDHGHEMDRAWLQRYVRLENRLEVVSDE